MKHTLNPLALAHYETKEALIAVLEMIIEDLRKVVTVPGVDRDILECESQMEKDPVSLTNHFFYLSDAERIKND